MTTIYLGMALRGAPTEWTNDIQREVRSALESLPDISTSQFVGLKDVAASTIYETDIQLARSADLMVALTAWPSLGLGMEIQSRIERSLPTVVFHPASEQLSGMVLGAPNTQVVRYESQKQLASIVRETVHMHSVEKK